MELKPGQLPKAKYIQKYSVPSGLMESLEHMLQMQVDKGYMQEVDFDNSFFFI